MGLFRRKQPADVPVSPPADPDPVLPALSRDDAALLERVLRTAFAKAGIETTSDGQGALRAMDGQVYGLSNLAISVATEPRSTWPDLAASHVRAMRAATDVPAPTSLDEVRDLVLPRLRWEDDVPDPPAYAPRVLPGVLEVVAIDYPSHVAELLSEEALADLGGWEAVRAQAMANLRALPLPEHEVLPADESDRDADVHLLSADDFFVPSRMLVLDEVMAALGLPASTHGTLVVVPHRHVLALHSVRGPGVVAALQLLARIGLGECDAQPGSISPHVYFLPGDGAPAQQVTRPEDDGTISIEVRDALTDAFRALGLVGEE